jgi:hypothetical protein
MKTKKVFFLFPGEARYFKHLVNPVHPVKYAFQTKIRQDLHDLQDGFPFSDKILPS